MTRVLVIVSGGIADYVADKGVDVRIFDEDNIDIAPSTERLLLKGEFEGFEDLMPEWVKEKLENLR